MGVLEDAAGAPWMFICEEDRDGWERMYIPTHRGEAAMDGAPGYLWLGSKMRGFLGFALRASLGMTPLGARDGLRRC